MLVGALATIPIAGPIAAGIAVLGVALANVFSGCGDTCEEATQYANQAETILAQNLQTYMSAPVHYRSLQAGALNNATVAMQALQQACSNPALGAAGQRCISERLVKGGSAPWCTLPGGVGCDWITAYYDPIANDPNVVPDPVPGSSAVASVLSSVGLNSQATVLGVPVADLLVPALLILAGLFL